MLSSDQALPFNLHLMTGNSANILFTLNLIRHVFYPISSDLPCGGVYLGARQVDSETVFPFLSAKK